MAQESELHGRYLEILAKIESLAERQKETREDAREARDAATKLTERVGAQDIPAKIAELRGDVEKGFSNFRADLVNSSDKITREMRAGFEERDKRIKSLEEWKAKLDGASGLLGWIAKNAPWLLAVMFAGLAAVGLKDRIHP